MLNVGEEKQFENTYFYYYVRVFETRSFSQSV